MIIVVGQLLYRAAEDGGSAEGLAARIGLAAASAGRSVQLVGKTGEDPEGDALLLALAHGGVGHVAVLRDAGMHTPIAEPIEADNGSLQDETSPATAPEVFDEATDGRSGLDAGDIDLALRYLTNFSVIVLAGTANDEIARVVASAADWADARLVVVVPSGVADPRRTAIPTPLCSNHPTLIRMACLRRWSARSPRRSTMGASRRPPSTRRSKMRAGLPAPAE